MTTDICIRGSIEVSEARRIAKEHKTTTTFVIRMALMHGLPIAKQRLESLRAISAKK